MSRESTQHSPNLTRDMLSRVHRHKRVSPMRIALVRQKYRVDGGGERIVNGLMSVLKGQGHQVTLISRQWDDDTSNVIRCNPPRLGRVLTNWLFCRAATREIRRHHFDLVQSHERIPGCQVYRAGDGVHREWLRQRRRVLSPLSRWWLAMSPFHHYIMHAEKSLFEDPRLRLVICNSRMVMREILSHFRIDSTKLRLIYNGVDHERFHPRLREQGRVIRDELKISQAATAFVFVGSGFARKGLARAIDAVKSVPKCHLIVVGNDKSSDRMQRRAAGLGLAARVHFVGVKSDVRPYYGAADALVLPTLYDPFPNVILEAMSAGLPVLTSTKCGGAELVVEGDNGYVFDALDVDGLAAAMLRLMDRDHCNRLQRNARETIKPLGLAAMRDKLEMVYAELLREDQ